MQGFNLYAVPELNGASIGDTQFVVGGATSYITVPVNKAPFNYFFGTNLLGTSFVMPVNGTPFLNDHLCSYATTRSLYVMSIPVYNQYSYISYTPVYTDSAYPVFQTYPSYPTQCYPAATYPVIRNKYLITPVESYNQKEVRFDLVSFDSSKILRDVVMPDTPVVKQIKITAAPGTIGFYSSGYFCATYYDKFFVYYGGQFMRIDTLGNVKMFGYSPVPLQQNFGVYDMFTANNLLFVKSGNVLMYSADKGETWAVFNDYSGTNVSWLIFRNVGNDLYATIADYDCQIWKVAFSGKSLNLSELNNDGLQSNLLTSITLCGKYVFITTPTGVFYRKREEFDQLKKPIR